MLPCPLSTRRQGVCGASSAIVAMRAAGAAADVAPLSSHRRSHLPPRRGCCFSLFRVREGEAGGAGVGEAGGAGGAGAKAVNEVDASSD